MSYDKLGDRMKMYEKVTQTNLINNLPVMIRIDGRTFSSLTRKYCNKKAFDETFMSMMLRTTEHLVSEIQNAKVAYVQSDEISILTWDNNSNVTDPWFDNKLQKIVSVSAAMATSYFSSINEWDGLWMFDARAWNIPEHEIMNYFIWRQRDWHRNSLSMYARQFFSDKELYKKNRDDMHEMLHGIGKNWTEDLSPMEKDGSFVWKISGTDVGSRSQIRHYHKKINYDTSEIIDTYTVKDVD